MRQCICPQMGGMVGWRPSVLSVQVAVGPTASNVSSGARCSPPATACRSAACICVHLSAWNSYPVLAASAACTALMHVIKQHRRS